MPVVPRGGKMKLWLIVPQVDEPRAPLLDGFVLRDRQLITRLEQFRQACRAHCLPRLGANDPAVELRARSGAVGEDRDPVTRLQILRALDEAEQPDESARRIGAPHAAEIL